MLTRLLPVHSNSWDVSKAKVATGVGGWCGPGGGSCTHASYRSISYCRLRDALQLVLGASGIGGAYLVPVRLHSDSTFAGIMCL